jgi:hypothetical protein
MRCTHARTQGGGRSNRRDSEWSTPSTEHRSLYRSRRSAWEECGWHRRTGLSTYDSFLLALRSLPPTCFRHTRRSSPRLHTRRGSVILLTSIAFTSRASVLARYGGAPPAALAGHRKEGERPNLTTVADARRTRIHQPSAGMEIHAIRTLLSTQRSSADQRN